MCKIVDDVKTVGRLLLLPLLIRGKSFFYFDIILFGQPFQSIHIAVFFMLHYEADAIAAFTATKTFIDLLAWRHGKGRSFFIVKRAEAKVVGTSFFQLNEITHHINNIDAAEYLLYGILTYQLVYPFFPMSKATKITKRKKSDRLLGNNISLAESLYSKIPDNL